MEMLFSIWAKNLTIRASKLVISLAAQKRLCDGAMTAQDNKMDIAILYKRNSNFCSNWLECKKRNTSEGLYFVPENFWHIPVPFTF